jgi:aminomethyltransferase
MSSEASARLLHTPLHRAHLAAGARMTAFAGYDMPVQYAEGVMAEHRWTRAHAGLFDVSHMGPAYLKLTRRSGDPDADHRAIAALVEPLIAGDLQTLAPGQLRYTLMLAPDGGILDDLMVGRPASPSLQGELYIVVNAATKDQDFALIAEAAGEAARLVRADDGGLLALQGPEAAAVAQDLFPGAEALGFMRFAGFDLGGERFTVARSGYTGEDGFEILAAEAASRQLWDRLAGDPRVKPIGLGARDSLRLEAGLPLYGHDLDPSVSPIEGGLAFAVSKRRLQAGNLRGRERLERELGGALTRKRVGLRVLEGAPAREGAEIAGPAGTAIGRVTSGGFSPTLSAPIAMGFVPPAFAEAGTRLQVIVRGKAQAAEVAPLPFVPHRYVRKP